MTTQPSHGSVWMRRGLLGVPVLVVLATAWLASTPSRRSSAGAALVFDANSASSAEASTLIVDPTFTSSADAPELELAAANVDKRKAIVPRARVADGGTKLSGRALDEDGRPLRYERLRMSFTTAADADQDTYTDENGRFQLRARATAEPNPASMLLISGTFQVASSGRCDARSARVELPVPLSRDLDLGDISLFLYPSVVAGTVRGPDGTVQPDVGVRVVELPGAPQTEDWKAQFQLRTSTDEHGRFVLRGTPTTIPFGLLLDGKQSLFPPQRLAPIHAGSSELELTLEPRAGQRLLTRVLLDPDVPHSALEATLERPDGTSIESSAVDARGISFFRHAAGRYDLVVCTKQCGLRAFAFPGVDRPPEVDHADPRLADIDLRGRFTWIRMRVETPDGPLTSEEMVQVVNSDGTTGRVKTDAQGNASVLVLRGTTQIAVHTTRSEQTNVRDGETVVVDWLFSRSSARFHGVGGR